LKNLNLPLPHLTGEQAFFIASTINVFYQAIWQEYGDAMADFEARVFPDHSPFDPPPPYPEHPDDHLTNDDIPY